MLPKPGTDLLVANIMMKISSGVHEQYNKAYLTKKKCLLSFLILL